MIALEIQDTRDFMNKLLLSPVFDHFCLVRASISTSQTVTIDGRTNTDYYDTDEQASLCPYIFWEQIKPVCFQLIKGKRTPLQIQITLTLSPDNIANVLSSLKLPLQKEQVSGLLLNIRCQGNKVSCTTGTSLTVFTLDRQLEQEWDSMAEKFLKKHQIISTHL